MARPAAVSRGLLKIDRPLVRPMQTDRAAGGMIGLIAALAQKMNLKAIAEGIESARQWSACLN